MESACAQTWALSASAACDSLERSTQWWTRHKFPLMMSDAAVVGHFLWSQITFTHLKKHWSRTRPLKQLRYGYCGVCLCTEPEKSSYVLLLHNLTTHWMVYSWGLFWPRELGVLNQRRSSQLCSGLGGKTKQADEEIDRNTVSLRKWPSPVTCSPSAMWPSAFRFGHMEPRFECNVSASLHVHMHAFMQKKRRCRR